MDRLSDSEIDAASAKLIGIGNSAAQVTLRLICAQARLANRPGVVVPVSELEWLAGLYDDNMTSHALSGRLYDASCTARKLLSAHLASSDAEGKG